MIKEVKIRIGEKEYIIKKTYRSLLEFEDLSGVAVTEMKQTLYHLLMLFYCIVKVNNKIELTFNQFVDLVDSDPDSMDRFNEYLIESTEVVDDKKKV